jgi:protease-4
VALRRGVVFVLVLIALAVVVSVAGVALMYVVVSRGPSVPSAATLVLRPGGELREAVPDDVFGQVLGRDATTVRTLVESLRKAARDSRVKSVLLRPSTLSSPYWAKIQELREAVVEFRRSGKTVVAFLEYGGEREYFLASAADRVYLVPTSPLDLTGVASYEIFLRGTLDRIGATPDFVHVGEYKSAPNQLTERGFTPEHREMAESLNRDMYEQLVRGIAEGRRKTEAEVRAIMDRGPLTPQEALEAGLVDDLAYEDQLDDRVPAFRDGSREIRRIEGRDYQRIRPESVGFRPRSRVAVLYAVGTIVSGRSSYSPLDGAMVGSDTFVEQIRDVRADRSIKAIVLRIDSPGGSAVGSDVIWRELMITREDKPERPLVVSMSDLAASGGYYIAMPGEVIVAQPSTLTGSIGIYGGKVTLGGTMDRLGVGRETVKAGANADIYSPFTPFTAAQRQRVLAFMQVFYDGFLEKAARSRKTTPDRIDEVARGRVWTGLQARERGLIDELGGLDAAVAIAKARAKIPDDEDVELVVYPRRRSLYEALREQFDADVRLGLWGVLAGGAEVRALGALSAPVRLFRNGEPLALMPFVFGR